MRRLGYGGYIAQGGDWGSVVTTEMARQRPAGLAGIHLNKPLAIAKMSGDLECPSREHAS